MDMELLLGQIELSMLENLKMTNLMDKELFLTMKDLRFT